MKQSIYLDNAATSWPKPHQMIEAMDRFIREVGGNSGRSGHHLSVESARIVYETRQRLADLFYVSDPLRIVFSANITESINLALFGLLKPGDHAITTSMEHNAVMRPLRYLEARGIELSVVNCSSEGVLDPEDIKRFIKKNSKLIVLTHASNVTGTILPIREIGRITREKGLLLLVDSAQTAGVYPIDMENDFVDLLAFTGHKSLYGPMGTGGLVIGNRVNIPKFTPIKMGGTGSHSEFEEQPDFLPDKYESGTLNVIGLAGLSASLDWIHSIGMEKIQMHEKVLCKQLLHGLMAIRKIRIYGSLGADARTAVLSFTFDDLDNARVGQILDEKYGILCRIGLHCAPAALKTIHAFPHGTIRFSLGYFNTQDEVSNAIRSVQEIAERRV